MIKRNPILPQKRERAQSLVEFALVLPLLLLVVYGLLEVGRLIFTYSIVISATREAVRYGSATGLNVAGGIPRYKDCDGIRAAAQNVDFLGVIDDANITISYDAGPGGASLGGCPPASVKTGDRIFIAVSAPFAPIITMPIGPITVRSSSARTIIVSLAVPGTALPPPTVAPPPPFDTPLPTTVSTAIPTNTLTGSETPTSTPTETGTPTNTFTPSMTFTPSNTPTITNTPTNTATPVNCTLVTHGAIYKSGNKLIMSVSNLTGATLNVSQMLLLWNGASGHIGTDTTLRLQSVTVGDAAIWGGDATGSSWVTSFLYAAGVNLPSGTSNIVFTFNQSYDVFSPTDQITLQLYNNGCTNYTVDTFAPASCGVAGTTPAINNLSVSRGGVDDTLAWTPSAEDVGGTRIYKSTSSTGPWTLVGTVNPSVGTFSTKKQGGDYYKVQPINSCDNAPFSNVANP